MKSDFEEFKTRFDAYLDACDELPAGVLFLRYEDLEAASHLHTIQDNSLTPERALQDHLETLTACQDYAVEQGVTSTYIFFKPHSYSRWLDERGWKDSPLYRAEWAQGQSEEELIPHTARGIIWFESTGIPARQVVNVLE
ncbi:MAG: hypothetical protein ACAI34_11125 [Verrucomicrobium sp.]|nr:hypothetical protein [Verrucomicrobium sp.]